MGTEEAGFRTHFGAPSCEGSRCDTGTWALPALQCNPTLTKACGWYCQAMSQTSTGRLDEGRDVPGPHVCEAQPRPGQRPLSRVPSASSWGPWDRPGCPSPSGPICPQGLHHDTPPECAEFNGGGLCRPLARCTWRSAKQSSQMRLSRAAGGAQSARRSRSLSLPQDNKAGMCASQGSLLWRLHQ